MAPTSLQFQRVLALSVCTCSHLITAFRTWCVPYLCHGPSPNNPILNGTNADGTLSPRRRAVCEDRFGVDQPINSTTESDPCPIR